MDRKTHNGCDVLIISVAFICALWGYYFFPTKFVVTPVHGQTQELVDERRKELEAELAELEKKIDHQRGLLSGKERESVSLERDIAILNAQIEKKRLEIRARTITINNLTSDIGEKGETIFELNEKIEREKSSLAGLLRRTRELDSLSLVEIVLSRTTLAEFFVDIESFAFIQQEISQSFESLRTTRQETEEEKTSLEDKKREETSLKDIQQIEKIRIESKEDQKQGLLTETRGEEDIYKKIIKEQEKTATQIRTELFTLRGTAAIPFGEALSHANFAFSKTGVRPALILGVIAEESNLGENLGSGNWKEDMHPERDQPVFLAIVGELGLDPDRMPVSKKPWYGWGGAMGPAQFIPSTWELYKGKIATLTGHNPPNPWDPFDAFLAAGVLLQENGAAAGGVETERLAALRYFAGWKNARKSSYAFYGDEVMELTAKYQRQIAILQGS